MNTLFATILSTLSLQTQSDEIQTVDDVDIDRFMGAWYVIAHIPTFLTGNAYNAVERYRRGEDNKVEVLFTYRDGGFDAESREMTPTGFISDEDAAEWGMRLLWPFKSDYRIAYLDNAYETTIIARNKRDYVWIMARTPTISEAAYEALVNEVEKMGYDTTELRKVPQQPLEKRDSQAPEGW